METVNIVKSATIENRVQVFFMAVIPPFGDVGLIYTTKVVFIARYLFLTVTILPLSVGL
jgi:hypothetical protein